MRTRRFGPSHLPRYPFRVSTRMALMQTPLFMKWHQCKRLETSLFLTLNVFCETVRKMVMFAARPRLVNQNTNVCRPIILLQIYHSQARRLASRFLGTLAFFLFFFSKWNSKICFTFKMQLPTRQIADPISETMLRNSWQTYPRPKSRSFANVFISTERFVSERSSRLQLANTEEWSIRHPFQQSRIKMVRIDRERGG